MSQGLVNNSVLGKYLLCVVVCAASLGGFVVAKQPLLCFCPIIAIFSFLALTRNCSLANSPGLFVFVAVYLIRYIVIPLCLAFVHDAAQGSYEIDAAVFYLCEELFVSVFLLYLFCYKKKKTKIERAQLKRIETREGFILWAFVAFAAAAILVQPSILSTYHTVFSSSDALRETVQVGGSGLLVLLATWGKMFLPIALIALISRRVKSKDSALVYWVSMVLVVASFCVFSGTSRQSALVPGVAGVYFLLKMFPSRRRKTMVVMTSTFAAAFFLMSSLKAESLNGSGSVASAVDLAVFLQAYFNGVVNFDYVLLARDMYSSSYSFFTMLNDLLGNCPGLSMDLSDRTTVFYNLAFYSGGLARDQIIPFSGQALFHLGPALFWIPSVLVLLVIRFADKSFRDSQSASESYIWAYVSVVFGMALMLNESIVCAYIYQTIVPCLIITKLNKAVTIG